MKHKQLISAETLSLLWMLRGGLWADEPEKGFLALSNEFIIIEYDAKDKDDFYFKGKKLNISRCKETYAYDTLEKCYYHIFYMIKENQLNYHTLKNEILKFLETEVYEVCPELLL